MSKKKLKILKKTKSQKLKSKKTTKKVLKKKIIKITENDKVFSFLEKIAKDYDYNFNKNNINLKLELKKYEEIHCNDLFLPFVNQYLKKICDEKIELSKFYNKSNRITDINYNQLWTQRYIFMIFLKKYLLTIFNKYEANLEWQFRVQLAPLLEIREELYPNINDDSFSNEIINLFKNWDHPKFLLTLMDSWKDFSLDKFQHYIEKTPGGQNLKDDFLSASFFAVQRIIENICFNLLASINKVQGTTFANRLMYALKRISREEIQEISAPVKFYLENLEKDTNGGWVSLDDFFNFKEND